MASPDLSGPLAAVEAELDTQCVDLGLLRDACDELANALRAARVDGAVPVLVSREAVKALREAMNSDAIDPECPLWLDQAAEACVLLAESCGVPDHPGRSKKEWVATYCARPAFAALLKPDGK
jgi:hypothetical protein